MFNEIARKALAQSVDLLVTPEYSFPLETLEALLRDGVAPADRQLWVLGCESFPLRNYPP